VSQPLRRWAGIVASVRSSALSHAQSHVPTSPPLGWHCYDPVLAEVTALRARPNLSTVGLALLPTRSGDRQTGPVCPNLSTVGLALLRVDDPAHVDDLLKVPTSPPLGWHCRSSHHNYSKS
jgi:hypothetical protein